MVLLGQSAVTCWVTEDRRPSYIKPAGRDTRGVGTRIIRFARVFAWEKRLPIYCAASP